MTVVQTFEDIYERMSATRPLPSATGCCVHLEDRYTGYTKSIVLKIRHKHDEIDLPEHAAGFDPPAELFEVVLYRDQALGLAAALINVVKEQADG